MSELWAQITLHLLMSVSVSLHGLQRKRQCVCVYDNQRERNCWLLIIPGGGGIGKRKRESEHM